jgi:hypothetical protein
MVARVSSGDSSTGIGITLLQLPTVGRNVNRASIVAFGSGRSFYSTEGRIRVFGISIEFMVNCSSTCSSTCSLITCGTDSGLLGSDSSECTVVGGKALSFTRTERVTRQFPSVVSWK